MLLVVSAYIFVCPEKEEFLLISVNIRDICVAGIS